MIDCLDSSLSFFLLPVDPYHDVSLLMKECQTVHTGTEDILDLWSLVNGSLDFSKTWGSLRTIFDEVVLEFSSEVA